MTDEPCTCGCSTTPEPETTDGCTCGCGKQEPKEDVVA